MRPLAVALLVVLGLALGVTAGVLVGGGTCEVHVHEQGRRGFPPGGFGQRRPVLTWEQPPSWAR